MKILTEVKMEIDNSTPLDFTTWVLPAHGNQKINKEIEHLYNTVELLDLTNMLEKAMATHSSTLLANPMDRGAWWAAVYGVAQSRTRMKWLSSSSTHTSDTDQSSSIEWFEGEKLYNFNP